MGNFSLRKPFMPVGLEIGTNTFRAVQIKSTPTLPIIMAYGSTKVPHGAVEEGEIVDIETVANVLSRLWKQAGFVGKKVILGVANQKVVARLIELPYMEKSELKGAIQFQAQEYIPIPVEEAIIDFQVVGEFINESEERMMEVLIVAGQKDMINSNVAALEKAYLRPEVIDVSSFAIVNSLLGTSPAIFEEGAESVALINIASGTTNIVVAEKGVPRFTRVTSLAGNDFTQAISDMLGVPFDEAEELKIKVGLPFLKEKEKKEET
ncbi:MAG: type IV pilus assembly protein PilM, partial [Candidatus Subteraquimicrobiales bacterium]|nr:type IV pilus assembly protein PilM [Candidatus Subteraquimicrobiales bacterium]